MKNLQNLHTHCTYCDGAHTPEQMAEFAIEKGFESLGFSSHSFIPAVSMDPIRGEKIEEYNREIPELKEKYTGRLKIYHGLEFDFYSEPVTYKYDYMIGSVHYMEKDGVYYPVDYSLDKLEDSVKSGFGGDAMEMVKAYYALVARLPERGSFDILGHFDLLTKFQEKKVLFDEKSREYISVAVDAMESVRGKIPFFEVNTGAISRGYRTSPYPSLELIKEFRNRGFGAVITTDCHDGKMLDCFYNETREILRECGFTERYVLTDDGFKACEI